MHFEPSGLDLDLVWFRNRKEYLICAFHQSTFGGLTWFGSGRKILVGFLEAFSA